MFVFVFLTFLIHSGYDDYEDALDLEVRVVLFFVVVAIGCFDSVSTERERERERERRREGEEIERGRHTCTQTHCFSQPP